MNTAKKILPDERKVLAKAVLNAAEQLGLTRNELEAVLGRSRSGITRDGLDPASKPGELALLLIRAYRALYVLVGGEPSAIKHWFHTENHHLQATPSALIKRVDGLVRVVGYLDGMRGKV